MQLGTDMLTPDILMLTVEQLAQNVSHSYYVEIAAHLVIEIVLPEQNEVDEQTRHAIYEQAQVPHYWTVDLIQQQFTFWQWTPEGYQAGSLDPDGCYRGVNNLSFSPAIFWLACEESLSPYDRKLPAFTSTEQPRRWYLEQEPGVELSYGSVTFAPTVGLQPQPISIEQFVSWCPETKLEGPPFPLLGGETGTRNARSHFC
ncbi:MAG: Uma2 family endonuclease [Cyanobacteria bacterium J06626_18]